MTSETKQENTQEPGTPCDKPVHPLALEIQALAKKLADSGEQFFLIGLVFTDLGEQVVASGSSARNIDSPAIFGHVFGMLYDELGEIKTAGIMGLIQQRCGLAPPRKPKAVVPNAGDTP